MSGSVNDYQGRLDRLITGLPGLRKPTLLLHSCCGPCSSYVLEYLQKSFEITVFYFNPCIYPPSEYDKRLVNQRIVLSAMGGISELEAVYNHGQYLEAVKGFESAPEGGKRCELCFRQRIYQTAKTAAEKGFDYFVTTLTVSPHKNAALINEISDEAGRIYGVTPLPSDFKKRNGYKRSVELSEQYGLYRQNYCGCEFSIRDGGQTK